jgi:5-oxoprolinase (ATP-hydrolysing) subunit A
LVDDIVEQCEVLDHEVASVGGTVDFVKPHGALYNLMCTDSSTAAAVVDAVARHGSRVLVAQAGSAVVDLARRAEIRLVPEGFPDRGYLADGRLAPRHQTGAVIEDPAAVARRALSLVDRGGVEAVDGTWTPVEVETLCIHGDSPGAPAAARAVRAALEAEGILLTPFVPELGHRPPGPRSWR